MGCKVPVYGMQFVELLCASLRPGQRMRPFWLHGGQTDLKLLSHPKGPLNVAVSSRDTKECSGERPRLLRGDTQMAVGSVGHQLSGVLKAVPPS